MTFKDSLMEMKKKHLTIETGDGFMMFVPLLGPTDDLFSLLEQHRDGNMREPKAHWVSVLTQRKKKNEWILETPQLLICGPDGLLDGNHRILSSKVAKAPVGEVWLRYYADSDKASRAILGIDDNSPRDALTKAKHMLKERYSNVAEAYEEEWTWILSAVANGWVQKRKATCYAVKDRVDDPVLWNLYPTWEKLRDVAGARFFGGYGFWGAALELLRDNPQRTKDVIDLCEFLSQRDFREQPVLKGKNLSVWRDKFWAKPENVAWLKLRKQMRDNLRTAWEFYK